jgi:ubiquinone/menaquinone biosynthesis C-methylase UbiE
MPHGHDVERFNQMAERYDRHWLQRVVLEPAQRTVLDMAAQTVPRPAAILDVGCGTGRLLRTAEQRFPNARLLGVDPAPEMVKQAEAAVGNGSAIRFQQATAEALPFHDSQFDLVFSTLTFHHWEDQAKGIREISRVLAPGGRWLVADLLPTGFFGLLLRLFRIDRFPERERFHKMLSDGALTITDERRVPGLGGQLSVVSVGR